MGPSSERLRSLSGRIFTSVLVFTLGIVLVFAVALTSIFYYSYECDAEQALSEAASRAASYLDDAPASDVTTLLSQQFSGVTRYTLISENGWCSTIARQTPIKWTTMRRALRLARPPARAGR